MKSFFTLIGILTLTFSLSGIACAATKGTPKDVDKSVPTNIKSERMEYGADQQTVIFVGKVHVTRPDFQLWADRITVHLEKSAKKSGSDAAAGMGAGDISSIVATKNVIIKSDGKEARASKATYTIKTDTLKLEGPPNPWLRDKDNTISGTKIIHYMQQNRSEIHGGVSATFTAPDNTQQKK